MSSADKFCKQFGPRSGPTRCWDPNCLTLRWSSWKKKKKKLILKINQQTTKSMKNFPLSNKVSYACLNVVGTHLMCLMETVSCYNSLDFFFSFLSFPSFWSFEKPEIGKKLKCYWLARIVLDIYTYLGKHLQAFVYQYRDQTCFSMH